MNISSSWVTPVDSFRPAVNQCAESGADSRQQAVDFAQRPEHGRPHRADRVLEISSGVLERGIEGGEFHPSAARNLLHQGADPLHLDFSQARDLDRLLADLGDFRAGSPSTILRVVSRIGSARSASPVRRSCICLALRYRPKNEDRLYHERYRGPIQRLSPPPSEKMSSGMNPDATYTGFGPGTAGFGYGFPVGLFAGFDGFGQILALAAHDIATLVDDISRRIAQLSRAPLDVIFSPSSALFLISPRVSWPDWGANSTPTATPTPRPRKKNEKTVAACHGSSRACAPSRNAARNRAISVYCALAPPRRVLPGYS